MIVYVTNNKEPWTLSRQIKVAAVFQSSVSSRWRTTSADRWVNKAWLISWLEKHYIWCSYFQEEVRPRRPCASESGSSLGWRHVTLAFRNPHDAAKSSQTKQTRRDLPLNSTRTHGSHLRRLAWKQSQILSKWQTVLVSCGLFVTDFPCSLTVKRPVIQKAFCLRATDTSLGFLYKSSLLPSSVA